MNEIPETNPLPGVKANDPDTGADDPNLSDEEIAKRLESDPSVDSRDGTAPEDSDAAGDDRENLEDGEVRVVPVPPGRPISL